MTGEGEFCFFHQPPRYTITTLDSALLALHYTHPSLDIPLLGHSYTQRSYHTLHPSSASHIHLVATDPEHHLLYAHTHTHPVSQSYLVRSRSPTNYSASCTVRTLLRAVRVPSTTVEPPRYTTPTQTYTYLVQPLPMKNTTITMRHCHSAPSRPT